MTTKAVSGIKALFSENPSIAFWIVEGYFPTGENENELVEVSDGEVALLREAYRLDIPKKGKYTHYKKGDIYVVKGIVKNPETDDIFVWYQAQYYSEVFGNNTNWVRPVDMFLEEVLAVDYRGPRYKFIGE